jgi:hypothetical protein
VVFFALPALLLLLTACISGRASEQHLQETREATRGAVLPAVQATSVAERFRKATATPAPTVTPAPHANELVLASGINGDNSPQGEIRSVSAFGAGTVYACARITHLRAKQTVIAVWSNVGGGEVSRSEVNATTDAFERWVAFPWQPGGMAGGTYAVAIYADKVDPDHEIGSLAFRVD